MPAYFERPLSAMTTTWRIFHEESVDLNPRDERTDFEELRGRDDTRIYRHGQTTLAVSTDRQRLIRGLSHIPGLTPKSGSVLLFEDALLDTVAEAIHAKRKRQITQEQRDAASERMHALRKRVASRQNTGVDVQKPTISQNTDSPLPIEQ